MSKNVIGQFMEYLEFIFNDDYANDDDLDAESLLTKSIANYIEKDVNNGGGIAGKNIKITLARPDYSDGEKILQTHPNTIARNVKSCPPQEPKDLENVCSLEYISFDSINSTSKKLHKNLLSLNPSLCDDLKAFESLIVPYYKPRKIWIFHDQDNNFREFQDYSEIQARYENDSKRIKVIPFGKDDNNWVLKHGDLPKALQNYVTKIKPNDMVVIDTCVNNILPVIVEYLTLQETPMQVVVLEADTDLLDSTIDAKCLKFINLISFSDRNDDVYLRMEDFITELNYDWDTHNALLEKDDIGDEPSVLSGVYSKEVRKTIINRNFIENGFEFIYLVRSVCINNNISFDEKETFINDIMFGISLYDGINDKYIGLSANYSFVENNNLEKSHFTYRMVPASSNTSELSNALINRLTNKELSDQSDEEKKSDAKIYKKMDEVENNPINKNFNIFHKVQLAAKIDPSELKDALIELPEDDNEELFWDTSDLINDYLSENHQTVVINFAYFDILSISRVSLEDSSFSCEFFMDIITPHDEGIDILQFHNLSKKDAHFEKELISEEEDPEDKKLKCFRYLISGNFDFNSIPANYPFDQQFLSITYSTTNKEKYGGVSPVPLRKIDNTFSIEGWDLQESNAGIARIKDIQFVGTNLSQRVQIKEVVKIGWRFSRSSSMTMLKILLPLSFLLTLNYYSLFVPLDELGHSISILTTVFLASIALYFSTERPQPLSMTVVDLIFASFYTITGITIVCTILTHLNNNLEGLLITPLKFIIPSSFILLGLFLYNRVKSKKYTPTLG